MAADASVLGAGSEAVVVERALEVDAIARVLASFEDEATDTRSPPRFECRSKDILTRKRLRLRDDVSDEGALGGVSY